MKGIEVSKPASPIPDFNGAPIKVLFCLLDSGLIVGALDFCSWACDVAVLINEINAIFLHVSTSCTSYRSIILLAKQWRSGTVPVRFRTDRRIFWLTERVYQSLYVK
jgi:hypothetical protein